MTRVATVEAVRLVVVCLHAEGVNRESVEQRIKLLIQSFKYNHHKQTLNKLMLFNNNSLEDIYKKIIERLIVKKAAETLVNVKNMQGDNHLAIDLVNDEASIPDVEWVVVEESNGNGHANYWTQKTASQDLVGMAFHKSFIATC